MTYSAFIPYNDRSSSPVHTIVAESKTLIRAQDIPHCQVDNVDPQWVSMVDQYFYLTLTSASLPRVMLQAFDTDRRRLLFLDWVESLPSLMSAAQFVPDEQYNVGRKFLYAYQEGREEGKDDRSSLYLGFHAGMKEYFDSRPIDRVEELTRKDLGELLTQGLVTPSAEVQKSLKDYQSVLECYLSGSIKWAAYFALEALAHIPLYHEPGEKTTHAQAKLNELTELFTWLLDSRDRKQVSECGYPVIIKAIMLAVFSALEPGSPKGRSSFSAALAGAAGSKKVRFVQSAILIACSEARKRGDSFTLKHLKRELAKRWHPDVNEGRAIPAGLQPFITDNGFYQWDDSTPAHAVLQSFCTIDCVPEFSALRTERKGVSLDLAVTLFGAWIEDGLTRQHRSWLQSYRHYSTRRKRN